MPNGPAAITRYLVGDGIPLPLAMGSVALVVIVAAGLLLARRLPGGS
jgi:hypothetical protein